MEYKEQYLPEYYQSLNGQWSFLKNRASRKERELEFTKEQYQQLFYQKTCYYCGTSCSGVDRKDNSKGYTQENSVPCCWDCNWMKGSHDDRSFIKLCTHLALVNGHIDFGSLSYRLFSSPLSNSFFRARYDCQDTGMPFLLSREVYEEIRQNPCSYCKKDLALGVDRIDSDKSIGYTQENCVPCCSTCNFMKHTLLPYEFLDHVTKVATFAYSE